MASLLAKKVETAIVALLKAESSVLNTANPRVQDSTETPELPQGWMSVAAGAGSEELYHQTGIYRVDAVVSAANKPKYSPTPDTLIAEATTLFQAWNSFPQTELAQKFAPYGFLVFGLIPGHLPDSANEDGNRVSRCNLGLVCALPPAA